MPRIKRTTLYKYDELSAEAQAKARDWWRELEASSGDTFWSESVIDDFQTAAKACGFDIERARGRQSAAVYWEGFSHQGSGASFSASWRASDVDIKALMEDRPAGHGNIQLRKVLESAKALADAEPTGYGSVSAGHRGHWLECEYGCRDVMDDTELQAQFKELADDLAHWLYRTLEREYEYYMSDEQVADTIQANEYEFTAEGEHSA